MTSRVHNFFAGPAALPGRVLERVRAEGFDFAGRGMSVLEISHREPAFEAVIRRASARLRGLMAIPDTHEVLFLQGGASHQFAMIPANFLGPEATASFVDTGEWSRKALAEAAAVGRTHVAASSEATRYDRVPTVLDLPEGPGYLHLTSNNTIEGTRFGAWPETALPLVADMSSDIASRPLDVSRFALIYAGAQKNLGPSGVTVVIARKDLIAGGRKDLPAFWQYRTHAKAGSLYHTPPTFALFVLDLVLEWLEDEGGLEAIERRNARKAGLVYGAIERFPGVYAGHAVPGDRSPMNVTFTLPSPELTKAFLEGAEAESLIGLAGHRAVGGCRASLYNAVSEESAAALADYMARFAARV